MNVDELNFAYKVRHALNENLDSLPASTQQRLASARKIAVSRKRANNLLRVFRIAPVAAGGVGAFFRNPISWAMRAGVVLPIVVLAFGLSGIYQMEEARRIKEIADIDAEVLADDLPLNAYVDNGFNAYLADRSE